MPRPPPGPCATASALIPCSRRHFAKSANLVSSLDCSLAALEAGEDPPQAARIRLTAIAPSTASAGSGERLAPGVRGKGAGRRVMRLLCVDRCEMAPPSDLRSLAAARASHRADLKNSLHEPRNFMNGPGTGGARAGGPAKPRGAPPGGGAPRSQPPPPPRGRGGGARAPRPPPRPPSRPH